MTKLTTGLHQRSASFVTGIWELAGKVKTQVILLVSNSLNREGGVIIMKYFLLLYFMFQSILNQKIFFSDF